MKPKELIRLINEGESSKLEFKRKINSAQKLAKELSALANTKGGYLIIGVDDNGTIYGIQSEKTEIDVIEKACMFHVYPEIDPEIEIINIFDKDLVVVSIEESHNKPHKIQVVDNGSQESFYRAYIRIGEKCVAASDEMTRLMTSNDEPLKLSIGDKEKRLFSYLEKKERATVKDFSKLVNISERRASRLLIRLVRAGILQIHHDTRRDYFTLI